MLNECLGAWVSETVIAPYAAPSPSRSLAFSRQAASRGNMAGGGDPGATRDAHHADQHADEERHQEEGCAHRRDHGDHDVAHHRLCSSAAAAGEYGLS